MNKVDLNENSDKERDDALEFYMRRCSELEHENKSLKERLARLIWTMEEHD
jgi:prefoldin subunit 5